MSSTNKQLKQEIARLESVIQANAVNGYKKQILLDFAVYCKKHGGTGWYDIPQRAIDDFIGAVTPVYGNPLSEEELKLEKIIDSIKEEKSTLKCIGILKSYLKNS